HRPPTPSRRSSHPRRDEGPGGRSNAPRRAQGAEYMRSPRPSPRAAGPARGGLICPALRRPRLTILAATAVAVAGLLLLPGTALAGFITPKSGAPPANEIGSLYKIVLYVAAVVFVVVEGALVYSVYKFRAKKARVAAQIHGNTRLEIGWTVAAALILVVLTVVTFVKLPGTIDPPNSTAPTHFLSP